ncbi:MAG TPA: erythromycin esterase family protein, partial [Bacteroidia bacterium]|nr:erythromycin esterase family protein [Bacteroidia bacterium]
TESLEAVMNYLRKNDKAALATAKKAAECFEQYGFEGENYARSTYLVPVSCENEVNNLLREIRRKIATYNTDHETVFSTEQNAITAVNAENYYRAMVRGGAPSWNIRDKHMTETLNRLMKYHGPHAKAIVWAHNTHIGDARATDMANEGMINIGEIVSKEHHVEGVVKIGFGSWKGNVIAGHEWDDQVQKLKMPEGAKGSWEDILHTCGPENKLLLLNKWKKDILFNQPIGHRAVGVVYNPAFEQFGNYVPSILPHRYDAFLFFNETQALHPLHIEPDGNQIPETYPFGV